MPTQVDYVAEGLDKVPPFLADGVNMQKLVSILEARWQVLDDLTRELAESVELSEDTPDWAMDLIGAWLNEPRKAVWTDANYLYDLRVKQRARRSYGTWADCYEVARLLRPGPPYATTDVDVFGAPKSVVVDIPGLTDPVMQDIAKVMLLRTVEATTQLAITVSTDEQAFTFDEDGLGWDDGLLVELVVSEP